MAYVNFTGAVTFTKLWEAAKQFERKVGRPLPLVGGSLTHHCGPSRMCVINTNGEDWETYGGEAHGLFLE